MKLPLSLEALEVVDTIERKGSFAAAATALHKVPSAISYTVQKLEQDLGVTLFRKEGRRAVLSPAGRHLVEQGRQLLYAADELTASTRQVATGWEPRLRIAVDTIVPLTPLLPLVGELQALHPRIEISIATEVLAGTWEALMEDRADLIVGGVGDIPGHKGLQCEHWREIEHRFVAAPSHPLSREAQPIAIETVSQHRAIIIRDSSRNSAPLSRGVLNQQNRLYVPTMEAKLAAHRAGLGVGYIPTHLATEDIAQGKLVELHLEEPRENTPTVLAWHAGNQGQALNFLLKALRNLDVAL